MDSKQRFGLIYELKQAGYGNDEINQYLKSKDQEPLGVLEKILISGVIPKVAAGAGGVAGFLGGGPVSSGLVSGAGYSLGKNIEDLIMAKKGVNRFQESDTPVRNEEGKIIPGNLVNTYMDRAAEAAGVASLIGGGASLLQLLSRLPVYVAPGKVGGPMREKIISNLPVENQTISKEELTSRLIGTRPEYQGTRASKAYQESQSLARELIDKIYPTGNLQIRKSPNEIIPPLTQKTSSNLNDIYKELINFETKTKAFEKGSTQAESAKAIAEQIRNLINERGGDALQNINKLMQTGYKIQPFIRQRLPWITGSYLAYRGLNKLTDALKSSGE